MTQRKIALSIEEAADYTGIGRNTLRKLVEWKKLPVLQPRIRGALQPTAAFQAGCFAWPRKRHSGFYR